MQRFPISLRLLSLLAAVGFAIPVAAQQPSVTLSGKVTGASGNYRIYVALWDASGFLNRPVQQVRIDAHASAQFQFHVAPGSWCISAYEDENANGKLDMGLFGPKEPSGFWRPFRGWHKPRFAEVSSIVSADVAHADIELRK
jgi:uncharacterized protein (DUF2141 family)